MSRTRRASILLGFGYAQVAVSMLSGIVLLPFILHRVGNEAYGLWLAFGDLLAYSALADFGMLDAFPWMLAEADGQKNRDRMKELVVGALTLGAIMTVVLTVVSMLLLFIAPKVAHVNALQRAEVFAPLLVLILGTAIAYPLRLFAGVIYGLQDAFVVGVLNLISTALNAALIAALLLAGWRLTALAVAATLPSVVTGIIAAIRVRQIAPDLLRAWSRPSRQTLFRLASQGAGTWAGALGWRMIAATNSLVIVRLAGPVAAVLYACTAKLGETLMQLTWQIPDAGLLGLAQLRGEEKVTRVREVVTAMLRLMLIGSGAVFCFVIAFNRSVVVLWVGGDRFAGVWTTVALGCAVIAHSVTHSFVASAATLGRREATGAASLLQGVVHLAVVVLLGRFFGLAGVASAAVISSFAVTMPIAARLLNEEIDLSGAEILRESVFPWMSRMILPIVVAAGLATLTPHTRLSSLMTLALSPLLGVVFAWSMRPLLQKLPWPERVHRLLYMVRLVPPRIDAAEPVADGFNRLAAVEGS